MPAFLQVVKKASSCLEAFTGAPGRVRIHNLLIRSQTLYPIGLRVRHAGYFNDFLALVKRLRAFPAKIVRRAAFDESSINVEKSLRIVEAGAAN